ncbi:hephaestus isoform y [Anaeramoeba flamelloides]|uniref:Hephaestus isoform y n=1 Tax=Anaeramoeba flamelloides TaxID=1746091 RepID=A0AAV7Z7J4_9EUKA|nr:hephaestus isoform y [Anaeramoeba flamelloides]
MDQEIIKQNEKQQNTNNEHKRSYESSVQQKTHKHRNQNQFDSNSKKTIEVQQQGIEKDEDYFEISKTASSSNLQAKSKNYQNKNVQQNQIIQQPQQIKLTKPRVLHLYGLPNSIDQESIEYLVNKFGEIKGIYIFSNGTQAFIEMSSHRVSRNVLQFYENNPIQINGSAIRFQWSRHNELSERAKVPIVSLSKPNKILLVSITILLKPVTIDDLYSTFSKYGQIEKTLIFSNQKHSMEAFIQFKKLEDSVNAYNKLNGKHLFYPTCKMKISYSCLEGIKLETDQENIQSNKYQLSNKIKIKSIPEFEDEIQDKKKDSDNQKGGEEMNKNGNFLNKIQIFGDKEHTNKTTNLLMQQQQLLVQQQQIIQDLENKLQYAQTIQTPSFQYLNHNNYPNYQQNYYNPNQGTQNQNYYLNYNSDYNGGGVQYDSQNYQGQYHKN